MILISFFQLFFFSQVEPLPSGSGSMVTPSSKSKLPARTLLTSKMSVTSASPSMNISTKQGVQFSSSSSRSVDLSRFSFKTPHPNTRLTLDNSPFPNPLGVNLTTFKSPSRPDMMGDRNKGL